MQKYEKYNKCVVKKSKKMPVNETFRQYQCHCTENFQNLTPSYERKKLFHFDQKKMGAKKNKKVKFFEQKT
jgi:hypothetical protein